MINADLFKQTFGIYAEEFWSFDEKQMLDWLNTDIPNRNVGDMIYRKDAIDAINKNRDSVFHDSVHYEDTLYDISNLPSAYSKRKKGKWMRLGKSGLAACECGFITDRYCIFNFCPKCGVDMRASAQPEMYPGDETLNELMKAERKINASQAGYIGGWEIKADMRGEEDE